VRNLAMRAADAAKNTAGLIEDTVNKVKGGSELVATTNEAFKEVAQSATKVGELVNEIAAASSEQAQGIDQTSKATAEMDKVTQQNAANAEESASASEELNAQAEQMKLVVRELVAVVGGDADNGNSKSQESGKGNHAATGSGREAVKQVPQSISPVKASYQGSDSAASAYKEINPETVIPMNDDDFKDF